LQGGGKNVFKVAMTEKSRGNGNAGMGGVHIRKNQEVGARLRGTFKKGVEKNGGAGNLEDGVRDNSVRKSH